MLNPGKKEVLKAVIVTPPPRPPQPQPASKAPGIPYVPNFNKGKGKAASNNISLFQRASSIQVRFPFFC